ncbi:MAG: valine--tRNA ligase, partial [Pseudomonadota bacterium]
HKQGLIYRDKRLVNWDPGLLTAISDLEVESREITGELTHFRYPLADTVYDPDDPTTYIVVATTRPETMLGDTAVAVHPEDDRYRAMVGRDVILPLVGRRIPIVADYYSDPEKGSGAVKITPAHDFNDFEVGNRHKLPVINVFDAQAAVSLQDNEAFAEGLNAIALRPLIAALHGKDRYEARAWIKTAMEEAGYLDQVEANVHQVPFGDRSGVAVEPFLTDQWYVNAKRLAEPASDVVREGKVRFVPEVWSKTYFDWMDNIQPWCISRQLWWGHQIPAWYGPDGHIIVERTEADALRVAETRYGGTVLVKSRDEALAAWRASAASASEPRSDKAPPPQIAGDVDAGELDGIAPASSAAHQVTILYRDEDVLDTWFSSALWPFSTLGWPHRTPELRKYYPTSVLSTGFDIIFFWVARMMMMGLHFLNREPFHTVYIHALVRDEKGAKMSKTKGNVVDPVALMDEFGADALRFTLAAMAAQGRDVKIAKARVQGYRNFATKLWNATRFADMNECKIVAGFDPSCAQSTLARWIVTEASRAERDVAQAIAAYRFNDAAAAIYRFTWNTFCDWYVELVKPVLSGPDGSEKDEIRATTAWVIDTILKVLHPFMPFLTEELWAITAERSGTTRATRLIHARWPGDGPRDESAAAEINFVVDLIATVRSVRAETNVPAALEADLILVGANPSHENWLVRHDAAIRRLARAGTIAVADVAPRNAAQAVVGDVVVCLPLEGLVDLDAERSRLNKEMARLEKEMAKISGRLANPKFLEKADEATIEEQRQKSDETSSRLDKLRAAIDRLDPAL